MEANGSEGGDNVETKKSSARDVIVITGTGGMGMAIARRLGSGRLLVLADFVGEVLEQAARQLRGDGHDVQTVLTDVSNAESVGALAETVDTLGYFRALVHTAGVSPFQASAKRIVEVDLVGTALVLDEFGKIAQPGSVAICIASMAGMMMPVPTATERLLATTPAQELASLPVLDPASLSPGAAYGIAKRANQVRVGAASVQWGKRGGRVVSVSPGVISTSMGQQELDGPSGGSMRNMVAISGTGRIGTPDDIAAAVEFLVSPAASFITGTDLLVDGWVMASLRYPISKSRQHA